MKAKFNLENYKGAPVLTVRLPGEIYSDYIYKNTPATGKDAYSPSLYKEQVIDPLSTQVGGDHYKKLAIQPMEYAMKNKLGPCEFNVVKYVTRWQDKGGIEDLDKAIQCLEILKDSLK